MCGMGRTGTLHACEQEGDAPDLMAVAKGLGGGYQPVGAVLVGGRIIDALAAGTGFFQHGHTYIGHPVACAAALAVQQVLARDRLVERCARQGRRLREQLDDAFREHPYVGDVRGRGLFQAIELVADRAGKVPFDPKLKVNARIKKAAMELGLMCYPMGGTIDGARGDHVLLAPPFIVSDDELDLLIERLVAAVDTVVDAAMTERV
jgi:adenosylmethionine-8-amino-7-oxononanoate aminotransferase